MAQTDTPQPSQKWVRLGCSLISTMLSCSEGVKFIAEDKLLKELSHAFRDISAVCHASLPP